MPKEYLTLEKISAYQMVFEFSNDIWKVVLGWDYFAKDTVGNQLVRSVDSISANIADGFGRYSKKDKVRIYWISMGLLEESADWIKKSSARELIPHRAGSDYLQMLDNMRKKIYNFINYTNEKLKY